MSDDRIELTERLLLAVVEAAGWPMSADKRVGEAAAAALLGWTHDSLRNKRAEGKAPPAYRIGIGAAKVTYRITDLARWIEEQRE